MSVLYYADGTQWWCKRCRSTVRARKDGGGQCRCTDNPDIRYAITEYSDDIQRVACASPWEPVCRKCLRLFRDRKGNAGFRRIRMPFSKERVYTLTLFGWTLEWAFGSCAVDTSKITVTKSVAQPIEDYDAYLVEKTERQRQIRDSISEDVQIAALNDLERRGTSD